MNNPSFRQLLETFKLAKLKFTIELQQDTYLPTFTGSSIHGLLGRTLMRYQPKLYQYLYKADGIKSYAVTTYEQHSSFERLHKRGWYWQKGELFSFEIKLFGEANLHAHKIIEAISLYGLAYGIGGMTEQQVKKYKLLSVCSTCRDHSQTGVHAYNLTEHINPLLLNPSHSTNQITLQLNSRLQIQQHNKVLVKQAPELKKILTQIESRLANLSKLNPNVDTTLRQSVNKILPLDFSCLAQPKVIFSQWRRAKDKNEDELRLDGFMGQLNYQILDNSSTDIIPWLAVGEQLQIGGKTTFGLGNYTLIC